MAIIDIKYINEAIFSELGVQEVYLFVQWEYDIDTLHGLLQNGFVQWIRVITASRYPLLIVKGK